MEITNSADLLKYLGGDEKKIFDEEVIIYWPESNEGTQSDFKMMVSNKVFKSSFKIYSSWVSLWWFKNCSFENFEVAGYGDITTIQFSETEINRVDINFDGELGCLKFNPSCDIGHVYLSGSGLIENLSFIHCEKIGYVDQSIGIKNFMCLGKTVDEPNLNTGPELRLDRITGFDLNLRSTENLTIWDVEFFKLKLGYASAKTHGSIENVKLVTLSIQNFNSPSLKFINLLSDAPRKISSLEIENSSLDNVSFRHCSFTEYGRIINTRLGMAETLGTKWPINLEGAHSENQAAYRQLKLLHQNHGDYRQQFIFHKLEMESFEKSEWERLKTTKGLVSLIKESVEYFVKVRLPSLASDFGLLSWKPMLLYFVFLMVAVNSIIIYQGSEIGMKYVISANPFSWDWSLFWHLFLPVHGREYNGVLLDTGIDVIWRVVAYFLIYHIIISSRRLLQQR